MLTLHSLLQSAGLVFVHAHNRLFVSRVGGPDGAGGNGREEFALGGVTSDQSASGIPIELTNQAMITPEVALWQFYFGQ